MINQRLTQQNSVAQTDGHFRVQLAPSASSLLLQTYNHCCSSSEPSAEEVTAQNHRRRRTATEDVCWRSTTRSRSPFQWKTFGPDRCWRCFARSTRCKNSSNNQRSSRVSVCNNAGKLISQKNNTMRTSSRKTNPWQSLFVSSDWTELLHTWSDVFRTPPEEMETCASSWNRVVVTV